MLLGLVPTAVRARSSTPSTPYRPSSPGLLVTGVAGSGPCDPRARRGRRRLGAARRAHLRPAAAGTRHHPPHRHPRSARAAGYLLRRELLPAVLPPVARHALLRLPGIALALASLGFLGLGAQPPSPEWGLLLAENQPYAERAPWAVLAPAAALALLGALAVTRGGRGAAATPAAR